MATDITSLISVTPKMVPPLDPGFVPTALIQRRFMELVRAESGVPLRIAIEGRDGIVSTFDSEVFRSESTQAAANAPIVERLVKFLLWQRGGWRLTVGGPREIG